MTPMMESVTPGLTPTADRRALMRIDLWGACALIAAALMVVTFFAPLWHMTLLAPQYPNDLVLTAYGTTMEGDLQEINSLNHYAGVKAIEPENVFELKAFPFLLFGFVAVIVASAVVRRRWLRGAVVFGAWGFPIGLLLDLQYWLYNYGHDLIDGAPLNPGPFTPKVIGRTKVVNFHSECMVSWGFWLMVAAALLVTVGPLAVRFLRDSWSNTGSPRKATTVAAVVIAVLMAARPGATGTAHAATDGGDLNAMIAAASPGSTLKVPAGTYRGQVTIDKTIALEGVGWPVIDGERAGDVIRITAGGVTIRGFVIQGSAREVSDEPAGIRVLGDHAVIEGNRVRDVLYGISLHDSDGHVVRGNNVQSILEFAAERRGHALYLYYTNDNVLADNDISYAKDGVFINFSRNNLVENNRVTNLRYGIHFMYADENRMLNNVFRDNLTGGSIMYSKDLYFEGNEFSHNRSIASGYGLLFKDVDNIELNRNLIHHNRLGLTMEGAPLTPGTYLRIHDNLIGYNDVALFLSTTVGGEFSGNTFTGNLRQVDTKGGSLEHHNKWQIEGRGNYWDDYRGYDANGDGRGDIEYRYRSAFGELIQRDESLKAYSFTPAQSAVDLAAKWFPAYKYAPTVIDSAPLMRPTAKLPAGGSAGKPLTIAILAVLALIPIAGFRYASQGLRRQW